MYAYIEGTVAYKGKNEVVIDANGVGYSIFCSMTTVSTLPKVGEKKRIYTFLNVRDDALELFGFDSMEEKSMFLRLTSVSGVGPKTALQILSTQPLKDLTIAIVTGDVTALSRAPGIGKKTAQRIVLELKEKVTDDDIAFLNGAPIGQVTLQTDAFNEALEALKSLGYTGSEATKALSNINQADKKADELIRLALRNMAGM